MYYYTLHIDCVVYTSGLYVKTTHQQQIIEKKKLAQKTKNEKKNKEKTIH